MGFREVVSAKVEQLQEKQREYTKSQPWKMTQGHFKGPEDLDAPDVNWEHKDNALKLAVAAEGWLRVTYRVPTDIDGINVAGSQIALRCGALSPTEVYIGGKRVFSERYWADFQKPEIILSHAAKPGEILEALIHMTNVGGIDAGPLQASPQIDIDVMEEAIFDLESFQHELDYCTTFPELQRLAADVTASADREITSDKPAPQMLDAIRGLRLSLAPAAAFTKKQTVHLVSHAHIDMNWLWDMQDTIDICRRDFTTMLQLIQEWPDFIFSQSQTSVYEITETHFPELFEQMRAAVKAGNWEITAATWTEGDLNMANGEAVARHLLYSKRYHEKNFERRSRVCWEPDTFGHPANTPQIMRKAGVQYYYHMRTTEGHPRFFHADNPLYWWEGLDGSRLLVFSSFYGSTMSHWGITRISKLLKTNHNLNDAMFVFGVGDHGGGPTRRDMRRGKWLDSLPAMPRIIFSSTHAFFDAVAAQNPLNLPVWKGEMNPVFDGCYTSHADIKRNNRQGENRLLEAETASTLASLHGKQYEREALEQGWRTLCFNQFHDIFDGCAIHSTYEFADKQMAEVIARARAITDQSLRHLTQRIAASGTGARIAVWNLLGFARTDIVRCKRPANAESVVVRDASGAVAASQIVDDELWFVARNVPALSCSIYSIASASGEETAAKPPAEDDRYLTLTGELIELLVEKQSGCIVHLEDKTTGKRMLHQRDWYERKTIHNNQFRVDYEIPHGMSAWIIGAVSRTEYCVRGAEVSVKSTGPVADVLHIRQKAASESVIEQDLVFYKTMPRIDFHTQVDWREQSNNTTDAPMLRVSFTPELAAGARATWGIPFGAIERPANGMEYPAQKWLDVSDAEFGFSLLNDGKYGFSIQGHTLTMTCIRTSYAPDPVPDKRQHQFSYALYPHSGDWSKAGTETAAESFNSPLLAVEVSAEADGSVSGSLLTIDGEGVLLTALKRAESGEALIARIRNTTAEKTRFALQASIALARAEEVLITEEDVLAVLPLDNNRISGTLSPFEIKTFRLTTA